MGDPCHFQIAHVQAIAKLETEVEHQEERIENMDTKLDDVVARVTLIQGTLDNGLSAKIAEHMAIINMRRGRRRDWILAVIGASLLGLQLWMEYGG